MSSTGTTVALLLTHRSTERMDREALRFVREGLGAGRTQILFDLAAGSQPSPVIAPHCWTFDSRGLGEWGYTTIGPKLIPGNAHLPVLQYFKQHPDADHYWVVEYDVAHGRPWRELFDSFCTDEADLLTCHLRRYCDEPAWYWWRTLQHPSMDAVSIDRVRGLLVISRYSRTALQTLMRAHAEGWRGHFEALVPTTLHNAGLKIADIGGNGPFTPRSRRGSYYSSYSNRAGSLTHIGSIRFRPARSRIGLRKGYLYHPVKEMPDTTPPPIRYRVRDYLRAVKQHVLWRLYREHYPGTRAAMPSMEASKE